MNKTIHLAVIIIIFSAISCQQAQIVQDLDKLNNKIVFVESKSSTGIYDGKFGDLIVFSLDSLKAYNITEDSFFDIKPIYMDEGKKILFQSFREGDKNDLLFRGIGNPDTYIYDLSNNRIKKIKLITDRRFHNDFHIEIESLKWDPVSRSIFFVYDRNKIYEYKFDQDTLKLLHSFPQFHSIDNISINSKERLIAFSFKLKDAFSDNGLAIFDYSKKNIQYTLMNSLVEIGDWAPSGLKILVKGRRNDFVLYEYDVKNRKKISIIIDNSFRDLEMTNIHYLNHSEIIFLAKKLNNGKKNYEVAKYNILNSNLKWITNDGYDKADLDIFSNNNNNY